VLADHVLRRDHSHHAAVIFAADFLHLNRQLVGDVGIGRDDLLG
jgi:hypothetical protein